MDNRTKPKDQIFSEYLDIVTATLSNAYAYESNRLLLKFRAEIGEFPPTIPLVMKFLTLFKDRKPNTKAGYAYIMQAFFKYYSGEKLPFKIKTPKVLPRYYPRDHFEKIEDALRGKKTHKKKIERDILFIETGLMTGLRAGELANLEVGDLHFEDENSVLLVRRGKGAKDRAVPLVPSLREKLAEYTRNMKREEKVFKLARKTISMKFVIWSKKAGVPHISAHSMRHYAATTLLKEGVDPRTVQVILGHGSLEPTMRYLHITGQDTKEAMAKLDPGYKKKDTSSDDGVVMPVVYAREARGRRKKQQ